VRAAILEDWRSEFNLTQEQIGYILGAGLFPSRSPSSSSAW
jgi:hypothetical protein